MSLVINTNVSSINGQRNLYQSTQGLTKSLERLSSGLRINRAGDDAAGLAISEKLRSQIKGLNQAVRNANDGISLIQTAEGAMDTYTQICQRIRVLAVQASSDVNSAQNRASIQLEIDQQLEELQRIATTIDFNGSKLFDGTFIDKNIQVGSEKGQTLRISMGDLRTNVIGALAVITGNAVNNTAISGASSALINGITIPDSTSASAIDKAAAIQSIYPQTGVNASVMAATVTGGAITGPATLDATNNITINGVAFGSAGSQINVAANDSDGTLRAAINAQSNVTGVVASLNSSNQLVLTAADGRSIEVALAGTGGTITGLSAGITGGRIRLSSDSAFSVANGTGTAADLLGIAATTYTVDFNTAINRVNVRTFEAAQNALEAIDNALNQINNIRAGLGAATNRLENTIANLQIVSENLSASDSRIRDADFAAETASLTRNQILQQSGVAVLAQANLTPQAALQLLQG